MEERNYVRRLVIAGLLLAIGVLIPYIFHTTQIPGNVFLPMHIPVLLGGFLLPPHLALILGIVTPLINSLLTTMPQLFPMAVIMAFELGFYGLMASLLYRKLKFPSIISLILAMIVGRLIAGVTIFVMVALFGVKLEPISFIIASITAGLPGIIIQLLLVPTLIHSIDKYTTINLD